MNFKTNESETKLRGGYYTRPEIASFLLRWVLAIEPKRLLEPSCGDGVFFRELARFRADSLETVTAFELEPSEAAKARKVAMQEGLRGTTIHAQDFLSWALSRIMCPPEFDAIVGNPPFIRYQYLDPELQSISERIFHYFGLPFTKHTNAWVPFVISSIAMLHPGGRLAMVLPAELLHVLHAQSLRTFLTRQCSRVLVFDPQELWFEDTLQGAILILAEKKARPAEHSQGVAIWATQQLGFLSEDPDKFFQSADYIDDISVAGKWMQALLSKRERSLLHEAEERSAVLRFADIAKVDVGIVTGANKFFLVPDAVVERFHLQRWSHPMFGRSEHVPGVIYDEETHQENRRLGLPSNFLWFTEEDWEDLPLPVREYIKIGEAEGLHKRYKCRIREPWYSVPSVYRTPVGMLKRCHHFPRLILNRIEAFTTDTAYRIRLKTPCSVGLVLSFVNSLTALSAELEGRHYGGGVLELVPSEIEKLLIPLIAADEATLRQLDRGVRSAVPAEELLYRQDEIVLKEAGVKRQSRDELRAAWSRLRFRRQRRTAEALGSGDLEEEGLERPRRRGVE